MFWVTQLRVSGTKSGGQKAPSRATGRSLTESCASSDGPASAKTSRPCPASTACSLVARKLATSSCRAAGDQVAASASALIGTGAGSAGRLSSPGPPSIARRTGESTPARLISALTWPRSGNGSSARGQAGASAANSGSSRSAKRVSNAIRSLRPTSCAVICKRAGRPCCCKLALRLPCRPPIRRCSSRVSCSAAISSPVARSRKVMRPSARRTRRR